jgi:hypothetical protein
MQRVLAFDIGIKNLAWCCLESDPSTKTYKILGWDNYNLLEENSNVSGNTTTKCHACSAKAIYVSPGQQGCARHCSAMYPPLRDCSGALLKKVPAVSVMKDILKAKNISKIPTKKADLEVELAKYWSMPLSTKKVSKVPDGGLIGIHDSIQKLVLKHKELWSGCTLILLENQPVFKNPTMKSVQILLFATLRDLLQTPVPQLKLVHAGKKVQGAEKGDAGYKDRKAGSEARAEKYLYSRTIANSTAWVQTWQKAVKKSDLADALSMCADSVGMEVRSESA